MGDFGDWDLPGLEEDIEPGEFIFLVLERNPELFGGCGGG